MDESFNKITLSRNPDDARRFSASCGMFLSVTGRPYTFLAAAYDETGALLEVRQDSINISKQGVCQPIDSSISFSGSPHAGAIRKVKTMLWDSISEVRPIVAAETFEVDEAQAGTYRYIAVLCEEDTVGGYVNEIAAYKKVTD